MPQVELSISVDRRHEGLVDGAISFETGLTRQQVADPKTYGYDHHGDEFSAVDPGALTSFYQDVLLGRPMPVRFAARAVHLDTVIAVTLFLHRDLITHPGFFRVVSSIDLAHRLGFQGISHLQDDLQNLVLVILRTLRAPSKNKHAEATSLKKCVEWVHDFVHEGNLTPKAPPIPQPVIKLAGLGGFVVAEAPTVSSMDLMLGWSKLYGQGHLRGILLGRESGGVRHVLVSRKSVFVPLDTVKAASALNDLEDANGHGRGWSASELWLTSPPTGTVLGLETISDVVTRVSV